MAWFRMMGLDSVEYHRATVLGRGDDHEGLAVLYYGSRGETPLEWGGRLAERLGLVGRVDDAGYEAIYGPGGARDPHLGTRLASTKGPGVELLVAAHKTVAVVGLIGRVEDMHTILDTETDATLGFLDEWFSRQGGRRGKAQHRTHTSGLLWARTRHATSRAGDPAPHDHLLIANLTEMLDDRCGWKALDTAGIRDLLHAATMTGRLAAAEKRSNSATPSSPTTARQASSTTGASPASPPKSPTSSPSAAKPSRRNSSRPASAPTAPAASPPATAERPRRTRPRNRLSLAGTTSSMRSAGQLASSTNG